MRDEKPAPREPSNIRPVSREVEVAVLADYRQRQAIEAGGGLPRLRLVGEAPASAPSLREVADLLTDIPGHVTGAEVLALRGMSDAYLGETLVHVAGILADRDARPGQTATTLRRLADQLQPVPPLGAA